MTYLIPLLIMGSAVYGLVAVFTFALFFSPFAGTGHLSAAFGYSLAVLTPYLFLYIAYRMSRDRLSMNIAAVGTIAATLVSAYVYFFAFRHNDGEYWVAFVVVPTIQAVIAFAALAVSMWRHHQWGRHAT